MDNDVQYKQNIHFIICFGKHRNIILHNTLSVLTVQYYGAMMCMRTYAKQQGVTNIESKICVSPKPLNQSFQIRRPVHRQN